MKFSEVRAFVVEHERHLSAAAMVVGFVLDSVGLRRPDLWPETLLLYFYLISSGVLILAIHSIEEGRWKGSIATFLGPWLPIVLQLIFGSMFSAFVVFYSRGASFSVSWPFLLLLFAVFAGTEIFKKYQDRLVFQCGLYFFGLFSFCVYSVPLAIGTIGTGVFLLSGAVAAGIFGILARILFLTGRERFKANGTRIIITAGIIYIAMNVLYFTHVLPPLPLSLKDIGVYHSIVRTGNGYEVSGEHSSWLSGVFAPTRVHIREGEAVFVFSSVFTPVVIKTSLSHQWEHYDTAQKKWVATSLITFPVIGGRDGGYRGFSVIEHIPEGKWRVKVQTAGKAPIGRVAFTVEYVSEEPLLEKSIF